MSIRIVAVRVVMKSFPGHEAEGCILCPHPVFEHFYVDTGERVPWETDGAVAEQPS